MDILPLPAFTDNYIWIMAHKDLGVFDCVDPGSASPVLQYAQTSGLNLRTILITHHHHDHIGGVAALQSHVPHCLIIAPHDSRISLATQRVLNGEHIAEDPWQFEVMSIPGHTATHIAYYEPHQELLFCGDTLFSAGCGRVFDGTMEELHVSLTKLNQLPPTTRVFCAHEYTRDNLKFAKAVEPKNQAIQEYNARLLEQPSQCSLPSTLGMEQAINPFLRTSYHDVIQYAIEHGAPNSESFEVFNTLRTQKNMFYL
jgi:hydroxyacylglutathione hydrolase